MTPQAPELLPTVVADRIEQIRAYTVDELGNFNLRGTDGVIAARDVRVLLVNENNRKMIVQALRALTRPTPVERPVPQAPELNQERTMADREGDKSKQPPECEPRFTPSAHDPRRGGWSRCPNLKETGGSMDGERYSCEVCGKSYFLDYDEMR